MSGYQDSGDGLVQQMGHLSSKKKFANKFSQYTAWEAKCTDGLQQFSTNMIEECV